MFKYLTCSPLMLKSCFSQNHGQAGFREELIQKTETYWPKMGLVLNLARVNSSLLTLKGVSSQKYQSRTSLGKTYQDERKKKMQHLGQKRQNLMVFILRRGAPQKTIFRFFSDNHRNKVERKKSRSKFLKGNFLSCHKALAKK